MTDTNIIDIDPENIVEHKPDDSPKATPKRTPKRKAAQTGLIAALMVICATAGGWFYRDVLGSYFPSNQVQSMATRIDKIGRAHV